MLCRWSYSDSSKKLIETFISYNESRQPYNKIAWFGPKDLAKPASTADSPDFAAWLKSRNIQESDFVKWVDNTLMPRKPFYPLTSDLYSARICAIAYDARNVGVGAFIKVRTDNFWRHYEQIWAYFRIKTMRSHKNV